MDIQILAYYILGYYEGGEEQFNWLGYNFDALDVNGDGVINVVDIVNLINILLGRSNISLQQRDELKKLKVKINKSPTYKIINKDDIVKDKKSKIVRWKDTNKRNYFKTKTTNKKNKIKF